MELVINNCYGGFNLSHIAVVEILKLKKQTYFAYRVKYKGEDNSLVFTLINDDYCRDYYELIYYLSTQYEPDGENDYIDTDFPRNDKELVQVVNKLGCEKSSGWLSNLEIVEIPDGYEFFIFDNNGAESVVYGKDLHRLIK